MLFKTPGIAYLLVTLLFSASAAEARTIDLEGYEPSVYEAFVERFAGLEMKAKGETSRALDLEIEAILKWGEADATTVGRRRETIDT